MGKSLNRVQLIGNLGADPETRTFQDGGKITTLRLATSETWKDRDTGEKRERVEWHSVSIRNPGLIQVAEKYLRKGAKVMVEGQLKTRKWQDQSGQDRYMTEVVLVPYRGDLILLGGGSGSSGGDDGGYGSSGGDHGGGTSYGGGRSDSGGGRSDSGGGRSSAVPNDFDDEIPF